MNYFDITPMVNHQNIPFIGHMVEHFNPKRRFDGSPARRGYRLLSFNNHIQSGANTDSYVDNRETEKNFIFAGIFFFLVLVPQTLCKMFGEEVEFDFYRCTGWPRISAGMGGALPPCQMLEEASLFPCEAEVENYHRMMTEVGPFMNAELSNFFIQKDRKNLNDVAYTSMLIRMDDKVEEFLKKVKEESERFTKSFKINQL